MVKDASGLLHLGLGICYEDLTIGRRFRNIGRRVTEADIVNSSTAPARLQPRAHAQPRREQDGAVVVTYTPLRIGVMAASSAQGVSRSAPCG